MLCLNSNETPLIYANKRYAYKKVSVQIGNITKLQILQQTTVFMKVITTTSQI